MMLFPLLPIHGLRSNWRLCFVVLPLVCLDVLVPLLLADWRESRWKRGALLCDHPLSLIRYTSEPSR